MIVLRCNTITKGKFEELPAIHTADEILQYWFAKLSECQKMLAAKYLRFPCVYEREKSSS